ncbi:MAG TPA: FkbM family methyltransferase [Opitutaceae bacterium]|nr:FkbM family methyltransferase [Opitutaceae bacterium]
MSNFLCRARLLYRACRYRWKLDPAEIAFVRAQARPATTAVDIGAHKGGYAFWMARAVGPAGRVIAFEPQPELAAALQRAFRPQRQVAIENIGISDRSGELMLSVPGAGPSPGASFETSEITAHWPRKISVAVSTLDACLARPRPRISLIKCDVEGHELNVFRGAEKILREERPALLFECEQRHQNGHSIGDVFDFLGDLGYRGFFFIHGTLRPLAEFDPSRHQNCATPRLYCNNFAFLPAEGRHGQT